VLDNFEQVLEAAPIVAELLMSVATLQLLATSRAPLRVRGERELAVAPLSLALELDLDTDVDVDADVDVDVDVDVESLSTADLHRSPAVRLFVDRARDAQPDFRLTSANGRTVAAICRRLDALPLALELAAPWIKVLTVEDLLPQLTDGMMLATLGPRDLPERQQTMNATVAWSYHLLAPNEQRAFRCIGALPGRFPMEAAAAVLAGREGSGDGSNEALAAVAGLVDKSLLLRAQTSVPSRPLYQMLETVRAYAAVALTGAAEREEAREGLSRYCSREASLAAEGLVGPAQGEWLDRVRDDLESYRSALTWLIERGRSAEASDIAWNLMLFWVIRGRAAEGLRWYEQILRLTTLPPAVESKALLGTAFMLYTRGELERARERLARALELAHGVGTVDIIVQAQNLYGYIEHAVGDFDAARDRFALSVKGFRALTLPWGIGNALSGLSGVALATGDVDLAERLLEEATSALRHAGPWFLLMPLYVRATLALRRGNPDEAIGFVRESLTRIRELDDKFELVYALLPLAAAAVLKGDDQWAARILGARDAVTERTGATAVDKSVHDLREQAEQEARRRLGPDRWNHAYAAGRAATIDSLMMDIDGVSSTRSLA
jgi:predicted ATPase